MIPTFLVTRYGPKLAAVVFYGGCALLAILLLIGGYFAVKHHFTAGLETQVKVGNAQTGAAIESGKEAVNVVGNRQAAEAAGATNVQEAQDAIDNANDPAGVTDAGLAGLQRVRAKPAGGGRR